VISSGDLYCCLLPRCEALRTCRSGFLIATLANALTINPLLDQLTTTVMHQLTLHQAFF